MKLYFYMLAYPEGLNGLSLCQENWYCSVPIVWVQIPQKVEQQFVRLKCNGYTRSLYLASFNLNCCLIFFIYYFEWCKCNCNCKMSPKFLSDHNNGRTYMMNCTLMLTKYIIIHFIVLMFVFLSL